MRRTIGSFVGKCETPAVAGGFLAAVFRVVGRFGGAVRAWCAGGEPAKVDPQDQCGGRGNDDERCGLGGFCQVLRDPQICFSQPVPGTGF